MTNGAFARPDRVAEGAGRPGRRGHLHQPAVVLLRGADRAPTARVPVRVRVRPRRLRPRPGGHRGRDHAAHARDHRQLAEQPDRAIYPAATLIGWPTLLAAASARHGAAHLPALRRGVLPHRVRRTRRSPARPRTTRHSSHLHLRQDAAHAWPAHGLPGAAAAHAAAERAQLRRRCCGARSWRLRVPERAAAARPARSRARCRSTSRTCSASAIAWWRALRAIGYEVHVPEGTFYLLPRAPMADDLAVHRAAGRARYLRAAGSLVELPGYFRISLTANDEMIERALPGFAAAFQGD